MAFFQDAVKVTGTTEVGVGSVPQGATAIAFLVDAGGTAIVNGITIPAGQALNFTQVPGRAYPVIPFDATGTSMTVVVFR